MTTNTTNAMTDDHSAARDEPRKIFARTLNKWLGLVPPDDEWEPEWNDFIAALTAAGWQITRPAAGSRRVCIDLEDAKLCAAACQVVWALNKQNGVESSVQWMERSAAIHAAIIEATTG